MEDSDSGMSSHDDSESGLPPGFKPDLSKVRAELAFEGTGGGPLVFNDHGNLGVSSTPTVFSRASSLRQQLSFESIVGVMEVDGSRPSRTQSLPTGKICMRGRVMQGLSCTYLLPQCIQVATFCSTQNEAL